MNEHDRRGGSRAIAVGLFASILGGCGVPVTATPAGGIAPVPQVPRVAASPVTQKATPATVSVDQEGRSAVTKAVAKQPDTLVVSKQQTLSTTWETFDPGSGISVLPSNSVSGPDEPDDDSDLTTGGFQTKWLWGWWGADGLARGLRTFAREEGRVVDWVQVPNGWTALRPHLTLAEAAQGLSVAVGPLVSRTPASYWELPSSWRRNTTRHLKFFRRQNVIDLQSRELRYYAARHLGSPVVFGYVVQAAAHAERYLAYYDDDGRLFGAFGTDAASAIAGPTLSVAN